MSRYGKIKPVDAHKPDPNPPDVSSSDPVPAETLEAQLAAVTGERDRLAAEKDELPDRMLRARAEFDNARRRADRERSDFLQFAAMDLVREILPVLDDFERALQVDTTDREYAKGVELIYQRLFDTLKKLGLEPINVYELVTFYPMFRQEPLGKYHIKICRTLSCALTGSHELREYFCKRLGLDPKHHGPQTTGDGRFTVEFVECLASCGTAPALMVNDALIENATTKTADELLEKCK